MSLSEPRRFRFEPALLESVDQMLLGAKIAQSSLSPVVEEGVDDMEQQAIYSENGDKTLERYDVLSIYMLLFITYD